MPETRTASQQVIEEVASWPGVEAGPGDRGSSVAFRLDRRELGHLHGDRAMHTGFPREVWIELREQGRIDYHPVFPDRQGPAAREMRDPDDVRDVIALLRLNYDRVVASHGLPGEADGQDRGRPVTEGGGGR